MKLLSSIFTRSWFIADGDFFVFLHEQGICNYTSQKIPKKNISLIRIYLKKKRRRRWTPVRYTKVRTCTVRKWGERQSFALNLAESPPSMTIPSGPSDGPLGNFLSSSFFFFFWISILSSSFPCVCSSLITCYYAVVMYVWPAFDFNRNPTEMSDLKSGTDVLDIILSKVRIWPPLLRDFQFHNYVQV